MLKELKIKDFILEKIKKRNATLESMTKKAVKIMQNPAIMQDAFQKFNFKKFVLQKDCANNVVGVEYISDTPDGQGSVSAGSDTFFREFDGSLDIKSESSPFRKGCLGKDLILVEGNSTKTNMNIDLKTDPDQLTNRNDPSQIKFKTR